MMASYQSSLTSTIGSQVMLANNAVFQQCDSDKVAVRCESQLHGRQPTAKNSPDISGLLVLWSTSLHFHSIMRLRMCS